MLSAGKEHDVRHMLFFYYGQEHLFVNLHHYICAAVEGDGLVFVCVRPRLLRKLRRALGPMEDTGNSNLRFINHHRLCRLWNLPHRQLEKVLLHAAVKYRDHPRIHLIQQIDLLLGIISEERLLGIERHLNQVLDDLQRPCISLFCAYNFKHYLRGSLSREVLEGVNEIHEHRFFRFNPHRHREVMRNGGCTSLSYCGNG